MKYLKLVLAGSFLLIQFHLLAQESLSSFLTSAQQDIKIKGYTSQIEYLNRKPYRLSLLQSLQGRVQNNEFGSEEYQYGLRITPANPWEVRNNNRVFSSLKSLLLTERELVFKEILQRRYLLAIELMSLREEEEIRKEIVKNISNQIAVLERQSGSSFFDPEEFIELQIELMQEQTDLESFEFEVDQKLNEIKKEDPGVKTSPNWDFDNVIAIEKLVSLLDSISATEINGELEYERQKMKLAENEYALEKSNINLGFIQPEFMPYKIDKSQIGVSLGITFPITNPNKGDMTKRRLDKIEAESDLEKQTKEMNLEIERLQGAVKSYFARYKNIDQKLINFKAEETNDAIGALNQSNPFISLKFNEQMLRLRKVKAQIKGEIYKSSIELLAARNTLNSKPLLNFLSPALSPL